MLLLPPSKMIVGFSYFIPVAKVMGFQKEFSLKPIYPHLHNDIENGQKIRHYHVDTRFLPYVPLATEHNVRVQEHHVVSIGVVPMLLYRLEEYCSTSTEFIGRSKIVHHCIVKGRCPHRGYDLSNVVPVEGVIKCPMHKLEFDAETGKLLTILKGNRVDLNRNWREELNNKGYEDRNT